MINRIHRGNDGKQNLRRTNIAGGFFTADMLLAGLQCQTQRRTPIFVHGYTDNAARHGTAIFIMSCEERRVRPAKSHRHPETLGAADNDIGAERARRREAYQSEKVGRHGHQHAFFVRRIDEYPVIIDRAAARRILQ